MAMNSDPDARIFTLDLPEGEESYDLAAQINGYDRKLLREGERIPVGTDFLGSEYEAKITQLLSDSRVFDFSKYTSTFDLVFIDGTHSSDYVKWDTISALEIVKKGGVLVWHDVTPGSAVERALIDVIDKRRVKKIRNTRLAIFINE